GARQTWPVRSAICRAARLEGPPQTRQSLGPAPRQYRNQVADLAAVLGLEKEVFKPVKTLSGGMKRKLEIIRGLMHRPRVLFLDEPTAGLDAASRRNRGADVRDVRAKYETTIFVTTNYPEETEGP